LTANNDSISIQADDNITLTSIGLGNINLNAPNINSFNYALPISFNLIENPPPFSYTTGSQIFERVYTSTFTVPVELFADTPLSGYTSTWWKIDFDMNTWDGVNMSNKGLAIYIDFNDQASNTYTPNLYNFSTPFCRFYKFSSWSGTTNALQSINWSDMIDFSALAGTTSSNLPLNVNLYIAGDGHISASFSWKVGLTRTNRV
jgi:alpha-amylase/alpha-mannosidase (GH57 family)